MISRTVTQDESCCSNTAETRSRTGAVSVLRNLAFFVCGLLFFMGGTVSASHFVGGQITWQNISGNTYQVTLKLYRDCSGINFGSSQTISVSGGCGGSFSVSEVSRVDITPLCPGQSSRCSGGSVPGVQEIVYRTNRTINPQIGNCTFAHSGCCRNSLVNSTVSAGNWYIASVFNSSTTPRNSSPQFLNPPLAVVCANQPATISPNAFDADGDALVYSLVSCKQTASSNAAYQSGFNYLKPISTAGNANFTINSGSGLISFTPTTANQAGIVCIRVEEYRGGVKIGEVIRDIQIQVRACNNNNPVVSVGANMVIQPGATACKTITVTDADGDNLTVTATSGIIPPGTFTILSSSPGSVTAQFCYTATAADQGKTFTVSINAQDNSCPTPGLGFGTFNVTVPVNCNNTSVSCSSTNESGSNTNDGTATASASGFTAPINYNWTGPGNYVGSGQTVTGLAPGTYIVQVVGGLGCVGTCTTTVNPGCQPALSCPNNITVNAANGQCSRNVSYSVTTTGCAGESLSQLAGISSGGSFPVGTTTNTFRLTQGGSTVGTCSFTVTVVDNQNPTISCPANISRNADAGVCGARVTYSVSASDNCPGVTTSRTSGLASGATFPVGTSTVSYTATDAAGRTASCSFNVTVVDNQNPTISCPANITRNNDAGVCGARVSYSVSAADNCPGVTTSRTAGLASGATFPVGSTTVSYTATDAAGRTASCSFTVTVNDNENPTISCPANISVNNDAGVCGAAVSHSASASDNCSASVAQTAGLASGATFPVGTSSVSYTATDASGNTASCSFTVTVTDNEAPNAVCKNVTVQLNAAGNGSTTAAAVNNNSSDNCAVASVALSKTSFNCSNVGNNTVTLTVTDVNGNSSTCTANVSVQDNVNPNAVCQNVTVQLNASGNGSTTAGAVNNGSSDACGIQSLSLSKTSFDCSNVGSNTVTLTVTDVNGNSSTCTANVDVQDNVAPNAVCKDITVQLDASGSASITASDIDGGSSDACGIASLSATPTSFSCTNVGGNTSTLTVTDVNGNSSTCTANVTIQDNVAPVAVCKDVTIQLDAAGDASITAADIDGGSSDACGGISLSATPLNYTCSNVGGNTATLTVTDGNGNVSTCTANVTVQDNVAPNAICQDVTVQLNAAGSGSTTAAAVNNGSNDNCGVQSLALSKTGFDCSNVGGNPVTLTVTDVNGNVSTCSANVEVEDNVAPVAVCQDVTVQLDAAGNGSTTAGAVNNGSSDACGIQSLALSKTSFDCSNVGNNGVTLTVTDVNGNSSTCAANVSVQDNVAPSAVCQDVTVQLDASGAGSITATDIDGGSSDACGIASLSATPTSFSCSNVGGNTSTLTVTDVNGNSSTCTANVTVQDNVAPNAVCQDVTVQLDASGNGGITAADIDGGSNDACGIASLSASPNSFSCSNVGGNTSTLTVTDNNGNVSTCTANVTVQDNVAPNAVCQDVTVQLDAAGNGGITAADIDGGSNDACGIASLSASPNSFDCSNVGGNTSTLTVTDNNGNVSTCTANVTVQDNVAPVALCQDVTIQLDASGNASTTASAVDNGSNDACGIQSIALSQTAFDCSHVGGNGVVLTVTDVNGNVSTCNANVTVQDNVAPNALCQDVTVQLDASGNGSTTASAVDNGSNDNCGIQSLALSQTAFNCSHVGSNGVVLTVTDVNGNVSTCNANVEVEDNVAPVALCQDVTVQLDAAGNGSTTASAVDNGSNDACGIQSIALDVTSFDCSDVGNNPVVLTVTDVNGNVSTCNANVTVEDNVAPVVTCPAAISLECLRDIPSPDPSLVVATDACGIASVVHVSDVDNGATGCAGDAFQIVRTYEATDVNGNSTSCTQTITVESTPIVTSTAASPDQYVFPAYADSACADISVAASGGCAPYTYLWSNGATTSATNVCPTVSTTYTVLVTDAEGCSKLDSIRICVIDVLCTDQTNNGVKGSGNSGNGVNQSGNAQIHIQMCHIPPGNPANAMTKCLPLPAAIAHIQDGHGGDHLGACGSLLSRNCNFGSTSGSAKIAGAGDEPAAAIMDEFEAFPNPFKASTNVRFTLGEDAFVSVKVYSLNGSEVANIFEGDVAAGVAQEAQFEVNNAAEGIYFARLVTSTGKVMTKKLILVK